MSETKNTANPPKSTSIPTPFGAFDPMAAFTASQQAMHDLWADTHARAHAFVDEYAQLEAQMMARAKQAIETWAQLAQDALAYSAQLSAQARKLGLEAAKKIGA